MCQGTAKFSPESKITSTSFIIAKSDFITRQNEVYAPESTEFFEKCRPDPLTCIRNAYTLASTQNASEVDELMVKHFLDTLAEVALTVASRRIKDGGAAR